MFPEARRPHCGTHLLSGSRLFRKRSCLPAWGETGSCLEAAGKLPGEQGLQGGCAWLPRGAPWTTPAAWEAAEDSARA